MASISIFPSSLHEIIVSHLPSLRHNWLVNEQFVKDIVDWSESIVESGSHSQHLEFIEPSVPEEVGAVS